MSISEIQKKRVFEESSRSLIASGERPRLIDVIHDVSAYLRDYPAGVPLPAAAEHMQSGVTSDVLGFNRSLAHAVTNFDVLYEATAKQQKDTLVLTTSLQSHLESLKARRKRLMSTIDDYLFSLQNTDGYYYSASDVFSDLSFVDLSLTSAFVDLYSNQVTLPTLSTLTKVVPAESFSSVSISVIEGASTYENISPFQGCVDGLSNTVWSTEVETDTPVEVILRVTVALGSSSNPIQVSRIDFNPYCISPLQLWIETESASNENQGTTVNEDFSGRVQTSMYQMSFIDHPRVVDRIYFMMRKIEPDYTIKKNGELKYRYIFGAKDIVISEHVYDRSASLISKPLSMPEHLRDQQVIDAVSLSAVDTVPPGTSIKYYIAPDVDIDNPTIGDFVWQQISKIDELTPDTSAIAQFDGTSKHVSFIRSNPDSGDMRLFNEVLTGPRVDLNPNSEIIPGEDIWRLCELRDEAIPGSLVLEEGVNTTKIIHTDIEPGIDSWESLDLEYWADFVNGTDDNSETIYGRIDTGNSFFSGGDIGEHGKNAYIETYLESISDQEILLKKFLKADSNSKMWDVKVFLNGREIAYLPVGMNEAIIPWKFNSGLNHIAITAKIPRATQAYPNPQMGTLDLFSDASLYNYGTVKLATWTYVDFFHMKYNEIGQPFTFTINEGEIISRRKPTDNFRLKYSKIRDGAPNAVRFRADLSRNSDNQFVSPSLNSYRLRFMYS